MRRRRSGNGDLAPSLQWILEAVKARERRGPRPGRRGEALALKRLSRIAALAIPEHGVLMPVDDDLSHAIERATRRPLDAGRGRRMLNQSLRKVRTFAMRDAIEAAHSRVVMDTARAYYYAGLAWGITFAEQRCKR